MRRWRGVEDTPRDHGRRVVTIGVFDGVHRGHQQIIARARAEADQLGLTCTVVTFDPHPVQVLRPGHPPVVLTDLDRKAELLAGFGVDEMCVLPFTRELAARTADEFVAEVLVEGLDAAVVVVGANFRFGNRAAGDVDTLRAAGERLGFTVFAEPILADDPGHLLSSTAIRTAIADGDVARAARALSRPTRVSGVVVRGDGRGRGLGYPTANLATDVNAAVPADGVYAGLLHVAGAGHLAAVSIGTNPTFDGLERRVEAYLLDFDRDVYGERVALDFLDRLRPTIRFEGVDALLAQMAIDVERTWRHAGTAGTKGEG